MRRRDVQPKRRVANEHRRQYQLPLRLIRPDERDESGGALLVAEDSVGVIPQDTAYRDARIPVRARPSPDRETVGGLGHDYDGYFLSRLASVRRRAMTKVIDPFGGNVGIDLRSTGQLAVFVVPVHFNTLVRRCRRDYPVACPGTEIECVGECRGGRRRRDGNGHLSRRIGNASRQLHRDLVFARLDVSREAQRPSPRDDIAVRIRPRVILCTEERTREFQPVVHARGLTEYKRRVDRLFADDHIRHETRVAGIDYLHLVLVAVRADRERTVVVARYPVYGMRSCLVPKLVAIGRYSVLRLHRDLTRRRSVLHLADV